MPERLAEMLLMVGTVLGAVLLARVVRRHPPRRPALLAGIPALGALTCLWISVAYDEEPSVRRPAWILSLALLALAVWILRDARIARARRAAETDDEADDEGERK